MNRHDEIRERLTDYVLGEIPSEARKPFRAHLDECAECAAEVRELAQAFHGIGLAEEPVAPPPHLRARVLASFERASRPEPRRMTSSAATRDRSSGWYPAWLALAAAAVLALGGMLVVSQQRTARLADELRRVEEDAARLTTDAATVAGQADLAVAILTASDMRRIDLQGLAASRDATARAYWSAARGLLIVADHLPEPPPGRTYQVWLIGSGSTGPVSAGLIDGRRSGRGMLIVPVPSGVTGSKVTVAVTDEPEGGLPAPTGSQHLVGSL
jgi:anti-sigma-K factor RskA